MIIKNIRHILQKFYASADAAARTEELTQKVPEELVFAWISNTLLLKKPPRRPPNNSCNSELAGRSNVGRYPVGLLEYEIVVFEGRKPFGGAGPP